MKTKTYIEKVSIPECTAVHHVWSFDGESPEFGALCECGGSRWDDSHLTPLALDGADAPKASGDLPADVLDGVGRIAQLVGIFVAWRFAGTHPTQEQAVLFILLSVLGIVFGLTMRAIDPPSALRPRSSTGTISNPMPENVSIDSAGN